MPGGKKRDPLSVLYDRSTGRLLDRAGTRVGTWIDTWVPSPRGEAVDDGGLTRHERAFQRSLYYLLNGPYTAGWRERQLEYSLIVRWTNQRGKLGRRVRLRLVPYASGYAHASTRPRSAYTNIPELQAQYRQA